MKGKYNSSISSIRIRYAIVSQDTIIDYYDNKEDAINYCKAANYEWLKYVQECIDNWEPYADNECFVFEETLLDGKVTTIKKVDLNEDR